MYQDLIAVIARITKYPILSSAHTDGPTTWFLPCSQMDFETLQQELRASVLATSPTVTAVSDQSVDDIAPIMPPKSERRVKLVEAE
jgi:hypothetical protein